METEREREKKRTKLHQLVFPYIWTIFFVYVFVVVVFSTGWIFLHVCRCVCVCWLLCIVLSIRTKETEGDRKRKYREEHRCLTEGRLHTFFDDAIYKKKMLYFFMCVYNTRIIVSMGNLQGPAPILTRVIKSFWCYLFFCCNFRYFFLLCCVSVRKRWISAFCALYIINIGFGGISCYSNNNKKRPKKLQAHSSHIALMFWLIG